MGISLASFERVMHPKDPLHLQRRQEMIDSLLLLDERRVGRMLQNMANMPPIKDDDQMSLKVCREIYGIQDLPMKVKGILDSTSGTTGNVLIRQDLEPLIYVLYVKKFPAWDRLQKGPSNGLVHAATQQTAPDSQSAGSTFISELGSVPFTTTVNARATFPIAVQANGRGVSLKEIAAVAQGGAAYNPQEIESKGAIARLASDAQYALMQGNASNSSGTGSQEAGLYNALMFDGFRGPLGNVGAFSANNSVTLDIGSLNLSESIQTTAVKAANNGGNPSLVFMSLLSKQALDIEQANNVRYTGQLNDLIPGVKCNQLTYSNGVLDLATVPGTSIGNYNRTSDGVNVEDIYVVDESTVTIRWLYSADFTVLQIPSGLGVGGFELSDRVMIFGMYGLGQAAPVFCGKARRVI